MMSHGLTRVSGLTYLLVSVLIYTVSVSGGELLPYEPIQYLKSHLQSPSTSILSEFLQEASPLEAGNWITNVKEQLSSHLVDSGTSVAFARGERVLVQHFTKELSWESKIQLPYSNSISLVSVLLPILLENYDPSVVNSPIGQIIENENLHSIIQARELLSLMDMLNKLPKDSSINGPELVSDLEDNGKLTQYILKVLLDNIEKEAWADALLSIGASSSPPVNGNRLVMDFDDLLQLSLTIIHDLKARKSAPSLEALPLDDNKYLFGWWFNCPKSTDSKPDTAKCLLPSAPPDTIFTLSPELRMYVTPSLELTVIITGPGASSSTRSGNFKASKKLESIADILIQDEELWKQFSSIASSCFEQVSQRE